jgi:hypothetical protein
MQASQSEGAAAKKVDGQRRGMNASGEQNSQAGSNANNNAQSAIPDLSQIVGYMPKRGDFD